MARRPTRFSRAKLQRVPIQPPEKTDDLKIAKKIPAKLKMYVNPSPYIEINNTQIHAFNKEIADSLRGIGE